jgi:hypothetical protein
VPRPVLRLVGPTAYTGPIYSANILQQEYGIDACVITMPLFNGTQGLIKGSPVQFLYGRSASQTETFTGYVHHVETAHRMDNQSVSRAVCIGAAAPVLRDSASRQWPIGSDSGIAAQSIADHLHLSSITESSNVIAPGGPVNESWWRYLVRMARYCGFTCYVVGTDLRFHSRRIDTTSKSVPWFQDYDTPVAKFYNVIRSYSVVDSNDETIGFPHRKRRAYGVTDEGLTVQVTDVDDLESVAGVSQDLPALTKNENMVVHDHGTAQNRIIAVQETNRFTRMSEFVVSGDERVRQASTTVMRGIGTDNNGYWYVTKAVHQLTTSAYALRITAGRDGVGDNAPVDLTTAVPVIDFGIRELLQAPAPMLQNLLTSSTDLVFPTNNTSWTASSILHRKHYPWRTAVRG